MKYNIYKNELNFQWNFRENRDYSYDFANTHTSSKSECTLSVGKTFGRKVQNGKTPLFTKF